MEGYQIYLNTDEYDQIDEPLQDGPDLDEELRAWLLRGNKIIKVPPRNAYRGATKNDQIRRR